MLKTIEKKLGINGNMISYSKSSYRRANPNNIVVFNSNIIIDNVKVWYGDIDITISKGNLIDISKDLNKIVYILYEMDARFDKEENPNIKNYVVKINPDGTIELNKRLKEFYNI